VTSDEEALEIFNEISEKHSKDHIILLKIIYRLQENIMRRKNIEKRIL
jgi:hypothetical protein